MSAGHSVHFGTLRIEKEIAKFIRKLPQQLQQRLYDAMKGLGAHPRPQQSNQLSAAVEVCGHTAKYRLRIGDYRILYDVDDAARRVVVLAVRRRSEKTYH